MFSHEAYSSHKNYHPFTHKTDAESHGILYLRHRTFWSWVCRLSSRWHPCGCLPTPPPWTPQQPLCTLRSARRSSSEGTPAPAWRVTVTAPSFKAITILHSLIKLTPYPPWSTQQQQSRIHLNPPPLPITHITLGSTLKKEGTIQPSLPAAQPSPLSPTHKFGSAQEHAEKSFYWLLCPPQSPPPCPQITSPSSTTMQCAPPLPPPPCPQSTAPSSTTPPPQHSPPPSPRPPCPQSTAPSPLPPPPPLAAPFSTSLSSEHSTQFHPTPPTLTAPFSTSSLSSEHMSPSSTMQASSMSGFKSTLRARWRIMRCMAAMHALESCWNTSDHNESAHYCTNTSRNMTYKLPTRSAPFPHATQLFLAWKVILLCVWTCTHTHTHTHTHRCTHTHTHTHGCMHTHTYTHPHRPTHTDTRIHTPTQRKP